MPRPERRPLGRSGLSVAPVALGGNVFGWTVDDRTGFQILDAFVSAGFNLIDTADTYSAWVPGHVGGESEALIGRWLAESGRRKEVVIATKVGMEMADHRKGLSRAHILESVEASLSRLRTDRIDLYQAHIDDPSTPLEETLGVFAELRDRGKVGVLGASNYSAERLEQALAVSREHGWPRFESLQPRYNLMDRSEYEGAVQASCRRHGLGVIAYSSLASGFLTGKYRSESDRAKSPRGERAVARLTERGRRILGALDEVSAQLGSTPAPVALAWVMARPGITAPIASATRLAQLHELLRASSLSLNASAMQILDEASA